jgi:phosphate-selective porin OprO/OprP
MDNSEFSGRCDWPRHARHMAIAVVLIATGVHSGRLRAQDESSSSTAILERLERLERDNYELRRKLERVESSGQAEPAFDDSSADQVERSPAPSGWVYTGTEPEAVFTEAEAGPVLDESMVRSIVAEELAMLDDEHENSVPAPELTETQKLEKKLAELDKSFKAFEQKSTKKAYPNVTVNGVFQADAGWIHQDANGLNQYGAIEDGSNFRRARLSAKGSVTELTNYFFQMDFGFFGRPTFTDVWLEQTKVPLFGNVRIGQWKQPFGLETVSSFRYTTFMERSVLFQPFTPFRHIGIGFYDHSDDLSMTWAASGFRTGQDQFGGTLSSNGGYGTAERLTWVPSWECDGRNYLHLGVGHFFNSPPDDRVTFRTIPEFFVGANGPGAVGTSGQAVPGGSDGVPFFISTGSLNVSSYNVLGSELLWVQGPFSLQSEAMMNVVNQAGGGAAVLPGMYAQAGYFLTGEHRPYDRKTGTIDRVIPKSNLTFNGKCCDPGLGAWEVAGRWSYLDLNDSAIRGGTIMDYTAGVNWYWNPYTKMVFNYVHAIADGPANPVSHTDMVGIRAQIDF